MVVMKIRMFLLYLIVIVVKKIIYSLKGDDEHNKDGNCEEGDDDEADMSFPGVAGAVAPWLVPVPVHNMSGSSSRAESVKKQLAVVQYQHYFLNSNNNENDNMCIVCMNEIEGSQAVRNLSNCSHAFHSHCLDAWIDQGHLTCPLCRSMLLPPPPPPPPPPPASSSSSSPHSSQVYLRPQPADPWRTERMIYLFGHDHDYIPSPT